MCGNEYNTSYKRNEAVIFSKMLLILLFYLF